MTEDIQVEALINAFGKGKTIAEIGCYLGNTTRKLALAGNKVIAIDPFLGGYDNNDKVSEWLKTDKNIKQTFLKNIEGLDVEFIEMKGIDAYNKFEGEIDGFFIDSTHTYDGVKEDSIWINKVKPNGILAFHDFSDTFPGVKKFIQEEIIPKYFLIKQVGSLMIFRK